MKSWAALLDGYLADSLSAAELDRFLTLVDSHEGGFADTIENLLLSRSFEELGTEAQRVRLLTRILAQKDNPEVSAAAPVRRIFARVWWAAAAVILLAIGTAVLLLQTKKQTPTPVVAQNDVAPGGNRAILTLGNGVTIVLDSAANGILAQQGNASVRKLTNGQLAYKALHGKSGDIVYNTLSTPKGGQYRLQLPDGTDVWLNSASSITYPTAFTGKQREVDITGEAYFEVVKDKTKPFRVKVNDIEVDVLGTHFNINAYVDEGSVKTTLLEGSVRIARGAVRVGQSLILKPGQQAVALFADRQPQSLQKTTQPFAIVNQADVEQVMAWKNGIFNFNGADLHTVMRQLSRWYDIDVKYEGKVPDEVFQGELTRDLHLSQVLRILGKMEVKFKIEGKTLTVMP